MFQELVSKPGFREQMKHPLVALWLLSKIERFDQTGDQESKNIAVSLFDEPLLRHLFGVLEEDFRLHSDLLKYLPAETLCCVQDILWEGFATWRDYHASLTVPILVRLDPERAYPMFFGKMSTLSACSQTGEVILSTLPDLLPEHARQIVSKHLDNLNSKLDLSDNVECSYLGQCLAAAWLFSSPAWAELFANKLKLIGKRAPAFLGGLSEHLMPGLPFWEQMRDLAEENTEQTISSLYWMFRPGVPVGEVDRLLAVEDDKEAMEQTWHFVQNQRKLFVDPRLDTFVCAAESVWRELEPEASRSLSMFLLALLLASWLPETWNFDALSLEETMERIAIDLASHPCLDNLIQHTRQFEQEDVCDHLNGCMEAEGYKLYHLIHLAQSLRNPKCVELLLGWMGRDYNEDVILLASHALCRFGEIAEQKIIEQWYELDGTQQIYVRTVLQAVGGQDTVSFLLESYEDIDNSIDLEQWCEVAKAIPDLRLIQRLESELRRNQFVIDEAFLEMCLVMDYEHPSFPQLHKKYQQDRQRVNQHIGDVQKGHLFDWEKKTIFLELRCDACGQANRYEVSSVFMSPDTGSDGIVVGGDLHCLSCGKDAELHVTPMARVAVMAETVLILSAQQANKTYRGPLKIQTFKMHDSTLMSPKQALEHYQQAVAREPHSVEQWLGLGNCLFHIRRMRKAQLCFERCLALDPACPEAALQRASFFLELQKDMKKAFNVLHTCFTHIKDWKFYRCVDLSAKEFSKHYCSEYLSLAEELAVPLNVQGVLSRFDDLFKKLSLSSKASRAVGHSGRNSWRDSSVDVLEPIKKSQVGRNDPCPCGSGKKYKKCCLAQEEA